MRGANRLEVIKDSTETIRIYPPIGADGPKLATACDVRIGGGTLAVTLPAVGSEEVATQDSESAAVNAAASEGDTTLSFASDPGFPVGLVHVATDPPFVASVLESGGTTKLADPLPVDVPDTTTVSAFGWTHALTATETDVAGQGYVKARFTIGGVVEPVDFILSVVSEHVGQILTVPQLVEAWPKFEHYKPPEDETGDETIRRAWLYEVKPELNARGIHEHRINATEPYRPVLVAAIRWLLLRDHAQTDRDTVERAHEDLVRQFDRAESSIKRSIQSTDDDDEGVGPTHIRTVRLRL